MSRFKLLFLAKLLLNVNAKTVVRVIKLFLLVLQMKYNISLVLTATKR